MTNVQRSKQTQINQLCQGVEKRIKRVFNRDVFSFYDGIIEKIDLTNGTLSVRIPDLGNSLYEDCKFMVPCSTSSSAIYPNFKINTPVIIGFKKFNLGHPIVFGSIMGTAVDIPLVDNTISISNNKYKILISDEAITISNGVSSIILDTIGIRFNGPVITANGEDLTIDDEGAV